MNNICHICGRDIVSPVDPVCECAEELAILRDRNIKLREGILAARQEGCACDFHLYRMDQDLLSDELLDRYCTLEQINIAAKQEAHKLRQALDAVWNALIVENQRGAITDTLWMPDEVSCTVVEFIDHTLNPE